MPSAPVRWCSCVLFAICLSGAVPVHAQTVTLAWDANPEPNIGGYIVGYGRTPGVDEQTVDVGGATLWTLNGIGGGTYYFRVYAYNYEGLRSGPSAEVSATFPEAPTTTPGGCQLPDPFASLGGGTCSNGNWLPPGMSGGGNPPAPEPTPAPPPPPPLPPAPAPVPAPAPAPAPGPAPASSLPAPTPGGCLTSDPFVSLGGGLCVNGGWLPPGMTPPGGAPSSTPETSPASAPAPAPAPPVSIPGAGGGCRSSDPFASLGGGTCVNGDWLPPGMQVKSCNIPDPFVSLGGGTCVDGGWLPPGMPLRNGGMTATPGGCITPDPFVSLGGGTCTSGNWLPPGLVLGGSAGLTVAPAAGCETPDPFVGLPDLIGECRKGDWVPVAGVNTTGIVRVFNLSQTFWGIAGDDGRIYRPSAGFDEALQIDGLRVVFKGKLVNVVTIPTPVTVIEIRSISIR